MSPIEISAYVQWMNDATSKKKDGGDLD